MTIDLSKLAMAPRPPCPRCKKLMVRRTAKHNTKFKGQQFWGCADYPDCKEILSLEKGDKLAQENLKAKMQKTDATAPASETARDPEFRKMVVDRLKKSEW